MASTTAPTTGRLFSVTYAVVGSTTSTAITYPTGCTSSSVSGTTTCVSVDNAGAIDPENIQGAFFSTNAPPPDFTMAASPSALSIAQGSCSTSAITVTSLNGFSGSVSLTATISPVGPSTSLSPTVVSVTSGGSATSSLSVCASGSTPVGSYVVTTTGTGSSISHSVTVSVNVSGPPDFSIFASPSSQTVPRGTLATFTITLTPENGFTGTVAVSATITPLVRHGPTAQFNPASVSLSGASATSTLGVNVAKSTPTGTYSITVTGTSGSLSHSLTVTLIVTR